MNGKQAKRSRREASEIERVTEALLQAHDRLHKGDTEGAHLELHRGLMLPNLNGTSTIAPLGHLAKFDAAFLALTAKHGMQVSYLLVDEKNSAPERKRLISGGDADLCQYMDHQLRAAGGA